MATAPLIADLYSIRCGNCKVVVDDHLATTCPTCGVIIDRIVSNHVGLAKTLTDARSEAGVAFLPAESPPAESATDGEKTVNTVPTAPIIVDLYNARCGECKVMLNDPLAEQCSVCGATFDRVVSNHVGLARKLERQRDEAKSAGGAAHESA